ncbi:hypothetical protein KY284_008032 [Solanum tuberosum]|nr:hypothetical protein KY284_008032 [Solanum tuberosum]
MKPLDSRITEAAISLFFGARVSLVGEVVRARSSLSTGFVVASFFARMLLFIGSGTSSEFTINGRTRAKRKRIGVVSFELPVVLVGFRNCLGEVLEEERLDREEDDGGCLRFCVLLVSLLAATMGVVFGGVLVIWWWVWTELLARVLVGSPEWRLVVIWSEKMECGGGELLVVPVHRKKRKKLGGFARKMNRNNNSEEEMVRVFVAVDSWEMVLW